MRVLIRTLGSRRWQATLRFGALMAKALSADKTLLSIVGKRRSGEKLRDTLDITYRGLSVCGLDVRVRFATDWYPLHDSGGAPPATSA